MKRVNERIAKRATLIFGTMWMFYAFFIYGLLPLIPALKPYESAFFYWSGWVQLWALPLLMVGGIELNRSSEERAQQDHETLLKEFEAVRNVQQVLVEESAVVKQMHAELIEAVKVITQHEKRRDHR